MNKHKKIIEELAGNLTYKEAWDLSNTLISKVTEYNKLVLLHSAHPNLNISRECAELRRKMVQLGFETPSSDEELYIDIIQPLRMSRIRRAL
jgi:hypothetical protein